PSRSKPCAPDSADRRQGSLSVALPRARLWREAEQTLEIALERALRLCLGQLPELGGVAQRGLHVGRLVADAGFGRKVGAIGLEQELLASRAAQEAAEGLVLARVGRNTEVVACLCNLAAECEAARVAVPVDARRLHLEQDLEGAALRLARVDDDGQVELDGEGHELAENLLLPLPERLGHPVVVEAD